MVKQFVVLGAAAALGAGCSPDRPAPTAVEMRVPLFAVGVGRDANLGTHLTGPEEVFTPATPGAPTPADSKGQGQAIFRVSPDGNSVDFRLIASNLDNVVQSHIHCGRPGTNGPIRMWLYPQVGTGPFPLAPAGGGRQDGVLATGTFDPRGVVCPAANIGTTADMALLDAMRAGLTYVNVHTNDGVDGGNSGPGDFPGGEIRGQLDHPGSSENH